jgi:hypothetical protein
MAEEAEPLMTRITRMAIVGKPANAECEFAREANEHW